MRIDELIKLNIEYLENIDSNKVSSLHRTQDEITFPNSRAYLDLMGSLLLEVIHQQFDYYMAICDGDKEIAIDRLTRDVESKLNFLVHMHVGVKDDLH